MNIPDAYYGKAVDENGLFFKEEKSGLERYVIHSCDTWFYGLDRKSGSVSAWIRLREDVDRSHNDVNAVWFDGTTWRLKDA